MQNLRLDVQLYLVQAEKSFFQWFPLAEPAEIPVHARVYKACNRCCVILMGDEQFYCTDCLNDPNPLNYKLEAEDVAGHPFWSGWFSHFQDAEDAARKMLDEWEAGVVAYIFIEDRERRGEPAMHLDPLAIIRRLDREVQELEDHRDGKVVDWDELEGDDV